MLTAPHMADANIPCPGDRSLSQLLTLGTADGPLWTEQDLPDLLKHQLSAPLVFDLRWSNGKGAAGLPGRRPTPGIHSFGDLLRHPSPPVDLLVLVKEFAKSAREDPNSGLPAEVAGYLYFAAVAAAMVRCGQRITDLADAQVRDGLQWVLAQGWVGEDNKSVVREGLSRFRG